MRFSLESAFDFSRQSYILRPHANSIPIQFSLEDRINAVAIRLISIGVTLQKTTQLYHCHIILFAMLVETYTLNTKLVSIIIL